MIKSSNMIFREMKNMKRNTTILSHSASKDLINSAKDIKNSRSTKQIDITNFMENKNEKIKNIDEKLEVHQSQISKNNQIIEELGHNFVNLKEQLMKQRQISVNEERKNKLLREQIERTNKILRVKNSKIQDLNKKLAELEKDNQSYKNILSKHQQNVKTIGSLRNKLVHHEQVIADLKNTISEKEREMHKQKDKVGNFEALKAKEEELNGQLLMKDVTIGHLKQTINELHQDKNRQISEKNASERKVERLNQQLATMKAQQSKLTSTITSLENKCVSFKQKYEQLQSQLKSGDSKLRDKEKEESQLRKDHSQLKDKLHIFESQLDEANKMSSKKDTKIQKLNQKIRQLENNFGDNMKQKEKLRQLEDKMGSLKKRGETLQNIYYTIVPQIQCPFGHQLNNPVTIIPCGHNYCLGCKKGYQKECMQCCGKLKIEAVYRNELMDDIMNMVGGIKQVIQLLK